MRLYVNNSAPFFSRVAFSIHDRESAYHAVGTVLCGSRQVLRCDFIAASTRAADKYFIVCTVQERTALHSVVPTSD